MSHKFLFLLVTLVLVFSMSSAPLVPVNAQDIYPSDSTKGLQQDAGGRWYMPPKDESDGSLYVPQAVGGPDEFGYIWNDSAIYSWIDATAGIDTGLSGYSCGNYIGPISLPFTYNYYENSYPEIWINAGGYITFSLRNAQQCGPWGTRFPEPGYPNNIIAPLWTMLKLASAGPANRVYYTSGGLAPNRYFVVEWYLVEYANSPTGGKTYFTYEAILYENGDIWFQYQTVNYGGSYYCDDVALGIENANGYDGLSYLDYCDVAPSGKAVHFTRPQDSARIQLLNPYHGSFTQPNKVLTYKLIIDNNGTLGPDTYNLTTTSAWEITFADVAGTPLVDTNADGIVDTGVVDQGALFTIRAEVQTPTIINPAEQNNMTVTITSVKNPNKSQVATIQTAVPVPFVQSIGDYPFGLYLAKPSGQATSIIPSADWGYQMAIDEIPSQGFAYLWTTGHYLDETYATYVEEIEYTILDNAGEPIRPISKLIDNSGATINTYDSDPSVSVAPDGSIGVLWNHWMVNTSAQRNYNIYFAILNTAGDVTYGPVSVTNNDVWGGWNQLNIPGFYSPSIAATDDNRFVLSWLKEYKASSSDWVDNIGYAIRSNTGGEVKPPTILTDDVVGAVREYYGPSVEGISNQQALVTYLREESNVYDLYFTVLDSDGNIDKSMTNLSQDGATSDEIGTPDIAQFNNGNIAIAWNTRVDTRVAVLDTSFNRIAVPVSFSHPAMRWFYYPTTYLSLASDTTGHVALTWQDPDWNNSRHLYYALINNDGSIQTPSMIFLSSDSRIVTGVQGYGSTSYTFNPTTEGVDTHIQTPVNIFAPPNGIGSIPIQFGNNGSALATSVTITATLSAGVTYIGDNSGVPPGGQATIENSSATDAQYTWNFSADMGFLGSGQFDLIVGIGDVDLGATYPITMTIASAENDTIIGNNTYRLNLVAVQQTFLPVILR